MLNLLDGWGLYKMNNGVNMMMKYVKKLLLKSNSRGNNYEL